MLYMIGLGLGDEKDVSLRGLEAIQASDRVFLEGYTSLLQCDWHELAKLYNKQVEVLGRAGVEQEAEQILLAAEQGTAAFLVIGDVFGATTHTDLFLRAQERGIAVQVIHNASILNAIGAVGLELYRFGKTTSLVYPEGNYAPDSFFNVIKENLERGLHTLCLFDIKAEQQRFMSVPEAIDLLLAIGERLSDTTLSPDTKAIGCARIGTNSQQIVYGTLEELSRLEWGAAPQCLIIPGTLHVVEEEMLALWQYRS